MKAALNTIKGFLFSIPLAILSRKLIFRNGLKVVKNRTKLKIAVVETNPYLKFFYHHIFIIPYFEFFEKVFFAILIHL